MAGDHTSDENVNVHCDRAGIYKLLEYSLNVTAKGLFSYELWRNGKG